MAVRNTMHQLLEDVLGLVLGQVPALLDEVVEVTTAGVLHHHHDMLFVLEDFVKTNNVGMADFFEDIDLLEHLLAAMPVIKLAQLDRLDGDELARQLVDRQVDLPESALPDRLYELVEVLQGRWRDMVLPRVPPIITYNCIAVFTNLFIYPQ